MRHTRKKVAAWLLTLAMTTSVLPAGPVFAENDDFDVVDQSGAEEFYGGLFGTSDFSDDAGVGDDDPNAEFWDTSQESVEENNEAAEEVAEASEETAETAEEVTEASEETAEETEEVIEDEVEELPVNGEDFDEALIDGTEAENAKADGDETNVDETAFQNYFAALADLAEVSNDSVYPFGFTDEDEPRLKSNQEDINNSQGYLTITAAQNIRLSFHWETSCESGYDYMEIKVNGSSRTVSAKSSYSGYKSGDYQVDLSAGNILQVGYSKDSSDGAGKDCIYLNGFQAQPIRQISFTGAPGSAKIRITDSEGETVDVNGQQALLTAGAYSWEAEAFGYLPVSGNFEVTDADIMIPVSMEKGTAKKVAFELYLPEGETAAVSVKHDSDLMDPAEDTYTYELVPADYSYTIQADGYPDVTGSFTVDEEDRIITYSAIIISGYPENAEISLKQGENGIALQNGRALVADGSYLYNATAFGYEPKTDVAVTVNGKHTVLDASMTETARYRVSFRKPEDVTPVITVKHGSEIMSVSEDGTWTLSEAEYTYEVKAEGYRAITGSFTVEGKDQEIVPEYIPVVSFVQYFEEQGITAVASVSNDEEFPWKTEETGLDVYTDIPMPSGGTNRSSIKMSFESAGVLNFHYEVGSTSYYNYLRIFKNNDQAPVTEKQFTWGESSGTAQVQAGRGDSIEIAYDRGDTYGGENPGYQLHLSDFTFTKYYTVSFPNMPEETKIELTGVHNGQDVYQVLNGRTDVPAGTYSWKAEKFGYEDLEGEVTVADTDITIEDTLTRLQAYRLTFVLSGLEEGVNPVITLTHENEAFSPQEDGSYSLTPAEYNYKIKAEGYKIVRGTVTVEDQDLVLPVELIKGVEWDGETADHFAGGEGTQEDPYQISNGDELAYLSAQVMGGETFSGKYVALTSDIDLGGVISFAPVGNSLSNSFKGSFDGQGYEIHNLYMSGSQDYTALFGYLADGASVKNLTVDGSLEGKQYVAGIAACARNAAIENCVSHANVKGSAYVAGIVAYAPYNSGLSIQKCVNTGAVDSGSGMFAGGIAGNVPGTVVVNCYNTGSVSSVRGGGIVGQTGNDTTVSNCYNAGAIYPVSGGWNDPYCGAIAGYYSYGTIENCYYLAGEKGLGYGSSDGLHEVSEEEMKSASTIAGLGEAFTADSYLINQGYPILGWQDPAVKLAAKAAELMKALPEEADVTLADKDAITQARDAYDALSDNGKGLISSEDLKKLTDAETKYAQLKAEADRLAEEKLTEAVKAGGTVTLDEDIFTSKTLEIPADTTVVLDLNGHTIDRGGKTNAGSVIKVLGTLTVKDSSADGNGRITGGNTDNGGGVYVNKGASFTLEGGHITGNKASNYAGGVAVAGNRWSKATDTFFTMTGGAIEYNEGISGGGVWVNTNAQFTMKGGSISNNSADFQYGSGGGLFIAGTVDLLDGTIAGNAARSGGGGIYQSNNSSRTTIENAEILNNTVTNGEGGGIEIYQGTVVMNGGKIEENTATLGGAMAHYMGTFEMHGGSIKNNTATGTADINGEKKADGKWVRVNGAVGGTAIYIQVKNSVTENFDGGIFEGSIAVKYDNRPAISLQGGTFLKDDGTANTDLLEYLAEGMIMNEKGQVLTELENKKQIAKEELAAGYEKEAYREEQQAELDTLLEAAAAAIDAAENEEELQNAVAEAKERLDEVKTDAQLTAEELAEEKETANQELTEKYASEKYREEQKEEVETRLKEALQAVEEAESVDDVRKAVSDAQEKLDEIKTDAQLTAEELAEEKETANQELTEKYASEKYREEQKEEVETRLKEALQAVEEAESVDDVRKAVSEAQEKLDEIKTDAQLTAEELAEEKETAKQELTEKYASEKYREEQKEEAETRLKEALQAVEEAESVDDVRKAVSEAQEKLDEVKTDAQLTAEELAEAKETAKQELTEKYASEKYREEQKEEAETRLKEALQAVEEAESVDDVRKAVSEAQEKLDEVKTDAQLTAEEAAAAKEAAEKEQAAAKEAAEKELAAAKEEARKELAGKYNKDNYRQEQQKEVEALLAKAYKEIDAAKSVDDVKKAVSASDAELKKVKTDAQLKAEENKKPVKGTKFKYKGNKYVVLTAKTAALVKAGNKKSVNVPAKVKYKNNTLKVVQINAKAFTGKKIRTVTLGKNVAKLKKNAFAKSKVKKIVVKTKKLKKKTIKKSLRKSAVKTVKIKLGKKTKTYLKKYAKIFTKKITGRKVTVK